MHLFGFVIIFAFGSMCFCDLMDAIAVIVAFLFLVWIDVIPAWSVGARIWLMKVIFCVWVESVALSVGSMWFSYWRRVVFVIIMGDDSVGLCLGGLIGSGPVLCWVLRLRFWALRRLFRRLFLYLILASVRCIASEWLFWQFRHWFRWSFFPIGSFSGSGAESESVSFCSWFFLFLFLFCF